MLRRWLAGAALAGGVLLALGCYSERALTGPSAGACGANLDPSQFGSVIVAIQGFAFRQTPVHVPVGGKVTWINCEPVGTPSHTTTADGGAWSSPLLDPGGTHTTTFPAAGTFAYHCEPHPSMTAQVIVDLQAAGITPAGRDWRSSP